MRNDRRQATTYLVRFLLGSFSLLLLAGCMGKNMLSSRQVAATDLQPNTYTVIRYRNLAVDYLTTVAFLDLEGDGFTIEPRTADYTYTVDKGLPTEEALRLAENFVRSQPSYSSTEIKAIRDQAGNLRGYEVRPIYQSFVYGDAGDVLDITYYSRPEHKIEVWIRLKPRVEQYLLDETRT